MPEEVVFLVENGTGFFVPDMIDSDLFCLLGAAVLVADPTAHAVPTVDELQRWSTEQQQLFKQQITLSEKGAREGATSGRAMSAEALKKRREREEKKKVDAAHLAAATVNNGSSVFVVAPDVSAVPSNTLETRKNMPSIPYSVVVPASSSSFEWYDPSICSYDTIESATEAWVWTYPSNLLERAKCGVFRSLREQGYFLGGGIKFGGDFLVYPGIFSFICRRCIRPIFILRRSTAVSFTFRCFCSGISDFFTAPDGNCCSW